MDRLLLISGNAIGQRVPQHQAVIDAAEVTLIAPGHHATEQLLAEAPLDIALLHNAWYTENFEQTARQALQSGTLLTSAGNALITPATRKDLAEAAAALLTTTDPTPGTFELAGDESWIHDDFARTFTQTTGQPIEVHHVTAEQHKAILLDHSVPEDFADFLVNNDRAIAAGEFADSHPGTLSNLIEHPTSTLKEVLGRILD